MPHLRFVADDRFPPDPLTSTLRGASLLEVRTTPESAMGRLLEWFRPALVAVLDLTRTAPRTSPVDTLSTYDHSSFDAVFCFGALRTRRLLDALDPATIVRSLRPGGVLLLSDFAPGTGEMWRHGALVPSGAPKVLEWLHRFGGLGLSWIQRHAAFADAGRLLLAETAQVATTAEAAS